MGIINVTPDSFSDGGQFLDPAAAVAHALQLIEQGAEIIDVGGESTRPNATPVSEAEELRRVLPVIEQLAGLVKVPISIDTVKPSVARAALKAGASIVNDVAAIQRAGDSVGSSAFRRSGSSTAPDRLKAELQTDAMWRVVAEAGAGYVCMHMQGTPQTMQSNPTYADVVREVGEFFDERLERLAAAGVSAEQVILDVGIGFGKTLEHNLQLLAGLESFTKLKRPMLLGVSRKSFIGKLLGTPVAERLPASLACTTLAVQAGVQMFRTHDVLATVQAVRMAEGILARRK
ncbi:MAG: dihydropteroate synthase [Verrucomicrobia bacterium]|nr:dihydropteroate synthase [Verrucomicrobiota bacterium]